MDDQNGTLALPPVHPGQYIREDVLPELGMTIGEFANYLGVKRPGLSDLINGRKPVSQDMAIRLGKALGTGARFWLSLQLQYDVEVTLPSKAAEIDIQRHPAFLGGAA